MRTVATISIIIVAITAATAASGAVPAVNVIKDPEQRFTIAVPWNWKVQTSTSARAPAVTASSPAAPGQLPDSVDVITQDLPVAITPQECADKAAQVMRFTIHRWGTVHEGAATFAGRPAYSRSYNWRTSGGQERRSVQTCVTIGRRAFVIVGTTANTPSRVQEELPKLEEIMATFRPNTSALPSELQVTPHGGGK